METAEVLEWRKRIIVVSNKIDHVLFNESIKMFNSFVSPFLNARIHEIIAERKIIKEESKE